jgi:hypothetical protein
MNQALVDDDFDAATQEFEQDEEAECERGGDSGHQMDMGQSSTDSIRDYLTSRGYQLLYIYHLRSAMFSGALPIVIWLFNSFSWMLVKRSAPAYICLRKLLRIFFFKCSLFPF